jgi:hypothetical protein
MNFVFLNGKIRELDLLFNKESKEKTASKSDKK